MPGKSGLVARINETWRITIMNDGMKWYADLHKRGQGSEPLGRFDTVEEAQIESKNKAQSLLPRVAIGELRWKRFFRTTNHERLLEQQIRTQEKRTKISSLWSMALGMATVVGALFATFFSYNGHAIQDSQQAQQAVLLKEVDTRTAQLRAQFDSVLATAKQAPDPTKTAQRVDTLEANFTSLKEKLANYEAAIGDDPAKRLAVPILRRDLDTIRDEQKTAITQLHDDINSRTELMKWLLILFGAGSFFSGLFANWPFGKKKEI